MDNLERYSNAQTVVGVCASQFRIIGPYQSYYSVLPGIPIFGLICVLY